MYIDSISRYEIYQTSEFDEWFQEERPKSRFQIEQRIKKIEDEGYFGNHKFLKGEIWELKFNDGKRIYYVYIPENNVLILLRGNKNGQDKDIAKAKNIYTKRKLF